MVKEIMINLVVVKWKHARFWWECGPQHSHSHV